MSMFGGSWTDGEMSEEFYAELYERRILEGKIDEALIKIKKLIGQQRGATHRQLVEIVNVFDKSFKDPMSFQDRNRMTIPEE